MYDLIIVGAGSGGYEGALYAHRRGMKVALVELSPETVGGNCLNRGCIPSKYMRHGAYMLEKFQKPYDLLEIDYGRLYIPFVKALVKEVKLEEGKVIVDESLSEV